MSNKNNYKEGVSILMPVKNCERYVAESIESILLQTYEKFEFVIIDDGSTDKTPFILQKYALHDKRIKIITNTHSVGISRALMQGAKVASFQYFARMDGDDIAYPTRLEKQVKYLNDNPRVIALGTQCDVIDENGAFVSTKSFPTAHSEIYDMSFRFNPLQHPTLVLAMHRLPHNIDLYDDLDGAEDLNLLFKIFPYGRVENLSETLLAYRIHGNNLSLKNIKNIYTQALKARLRGVINYGYKPTILNIITTVIQSAVVFTLPNSILLRLYMYERGMKSIKKESKSNYKVV